MLEALARKGGQRALKTLEIPQTNSAFAGRTAETGPTSLQGWVQTFDSDDRAILWPRNRSFTVLDLERPLDHLHRSLRRKPLPRLWTVWALD
jgi:hypothetical protein